MTQKLCPICKEDHLETCHINGDWCVKFYFDNYLISTDVIAGSEEQAIRFAEAKIYEETGLTLENPDEIATDLYGVYA
jgi:hypothetical protein